MTLTLALGGCGIDLSALDGTEAKTPAQKAAALGTDELIVAQLVSALGTSIDLIERTRKAYPQLGRRLESLRAAEKGHLTVLRKAVTAGEIPSISASTPALAGSKPAALAAAVSGAKALHAAYQAAALKAESGRFAQLLAAMAAAVSQRLPTLGAAA